MKKCFYIYNILCKSECHLKDELKLSGNLGNSLLFLCVLEVCKHRGDRQRYRLFYLLEITCNFLMFDAFMDVGVCVIPIGQPQT